jgi:threonyl-tRNA synthetase
LLKFSFLRGRFIYHQLSIMKEMSPLEELRHSASHILATAVLRLFPDTQLDIGPPTDGGFYYDFDTEHRFTREDLDRLEVEMARVVKEQQAFERVECSRDEATARIREFGQSRYKLGRLGDIPDGEVISFYRNGEFIDLCAGTHLKNTSELRAFKLLSIAGAYHRGSEKNKQLQRIYGTAFPTREELQRYLHQLEEAQRRDHRKLGRELQLFHIDESVGQGLVLWTPRGAIVRQELQDFIMRELRKQGYQQVFTPHIGKLDLYRTSGHFPYYQDSQFPPIVEPETLLRLRDEGASCADLSNRLVSGEINGFMLKPMNCPHHIKIFRSEEHTSELQSP